MLAAAKKTLWDACTVDLSSLELPFIPRRSSEKRSQASADLEDILLAFNKIDEVDKIPQIYCEAAELVKLPPVVTDPISMLVSSNAACLNELDGKISQLQVDFKTFHPNSNLVRPWILYPPHPMRVLLSPQSIATPLLVVQVQ